MIKGSLRFKKDHQTTNCNSSPAMTSYTNHNSSVDTKVSASIPPILHENFNIINLKCGSELTFTEKFCDRLTMSKHAKRHLNQFTVKEVETDNSYSPSSRACNSYNMEKIIEKEVQKFLAGCVLVQSPYCQWAFTVQSLNRSEGTS